MAWLLNGDKVIATAEEATSFYQRSKGLLGKSEYSGAMLFRGTKGVHTFAMHFTLDIAFLDKDFEVIAIKTVRPWRVSMPSLRTRNVLEAQEGAFSRWGLHIGDVLEVKD